MKKKGYPDKTTNWENRMKQQLTKYMKTTSMIAQNARNQVMVAIILLAVIPALSLFYIGRSVNDGPFTFSYISIIFLLTLLVGFLGFVVLRKYPDNIVKLRQYITEVAQGTLPEKITLIDAQDSDDLRYIQETFNSVLKEMRHQIDTIEKQQQTLLEAERHRVMIQTLGAACHHIGQPATVLQIRMEFLQKLATNEAEIREIAACVEAVNTIADILHQLQQISEFRTVPYVQTGDAPHEEILAISSNA